MSNTSPLRAGARHLPARIIVAVAVAALPVGVTAAPALTAPLVAQDEPWQSDCDHTGNFAWQAERGQVQWSDCDINGQWRLSGHGHGHGGWQWKHIIPPNPWWTWIPGNWHSWFPGDFGSF